MANISEIQIGNTTYALVDATVQSGLSGKQNTISDLSTIRSNASTGKSQAATAITRIGNFSFSVVTATNASKITFAASSAQGALGAENELEMSTKTAPSGHTYLGTAGWYTGSPAIITTRLNHTSGITYIHGRNMTTSAVTVAKGDANCRDIYLKKG